MKPDVSVIIPCYRQGAFLRETIHSALGQHGCRVEVVVVNDGSDDETEEIARSFGDRIRFVSQENRGLARARNAGIGASSGDYLHFLDADDRLRSSGLAALLAASGTGRLVRGRVAYFGEHQSRNPATHWERLPEPLMAGLSDEEALLVGNLTAPCAWLCAREAVNRLGGFDHHYPGCEDWDLWTRLVLQGAQIRRVDDVVADYRLHTTSMTATNSKRMEWVDFDLLRRNLQEASGCRPGRTTAADLGIRIKEKMRKSLLAAAYLHRQAGEPKQALHALVNAIAWSGLRAGDLMEAVKIAAVTLSGPGRRSEARA